MSGSSADGVGTLAIMSAGLPAGEWPALLVNGHVYVGRLHTIAWELAKRAEPIEIYGIVEIDVDGHVVRWLYR